MSSTPAKRPHNTRGDAQLTQALAASAALGEAEGKARSQDSKSHAAAAGASAASPAAAVDQGLNHEDVALALSAFRDRADNRMNGLHEKIVKTDEKIGAVVAKVDALVGAVKELQEQNKQLMTMIMQRQSFAAPAAEVKLDRFEAVSVKAAAAQPMLGLTAADSAAIKAAHAPESKVTSFSLDLSAAGAGSGVARVSEQELIASLSKRVREHSEGADPTGYKPKGAAELYSALGKLIAAHPPSSGALHHFWMGHNTACGTMASRHGDEAAIAYHTGTVKLLAEAKDDPEKLNFYLFSAQSPIVALHSACREMRKKAGDGGSRRSRRGKSGGGAGGQQQPAGGHFQQHGKAKAAAADTQRSS